ncbi:MAG: hypothetical protein ACLQVA_03305 [Candidatus Brocadiia bacterium]
MKRLVMICLLLAAAAMPVSIASAQTDWRGPKELADNAALKYWLAFGTLTTLTDADYNLIMNWHGSGPDPAAAHVVELCETSLRMFHEAVKCKWCNWGLVNEGPGTEMPHLAKVRELARRACFRARYRAATGDGNGAVEDILAVFALSRHCNADSSPIAYLVRLAIQRLATNAAADTLERLNPEQLGKLAEGLDSLPQCCSLRDAFLDESENRFGWWADHIKRGGIKAAEEFRRLDSAEDEAQKANSKEPITEEDVARYVHDLEVVQRCWALVADMAAMPPAEFTARSQALEEKMKKGCTTLPELFNHPVSVFRNHGARIDASFAMLKAAIAVVLNGPDSLKSIQDPFGDGPFEYTAVGTGFQLKSKFAFEGKPVELTVPGT